VDASKPCGVLCAGNLVFDVRVRPVTELCWGESTWVDAIEHSMGGNGASTAYTLARLGMAVRMLGMVGADMWGDAVMKRLSDVGVDTSHVLRSHAPTAASVALVGSDGARALLHQPGAGFEAFPVPIVFHNAMIDALSQATARAPRWLSTAPETIFSSS
jgi:sugar/nucleoside kinase (ribokinase family)